MLRISPKDIFEKFKGGEPLEEIARNLDTEPEFIEALIRAIAVGIDIGQPRCYHCESEYLWDATFT